MGRKHDDEDDDEDDESEEVDSVTRDWKEVVIKGFGMAPGILNLATFKTPLLVGMEVGADTAVEFSSLMVIMYPSISISLISLHITRPIIERGKHCESRGTTATSLPPF